MEVRLIRRDKADSIADRAADIGAAGGMAGRLPFGDVERIAERPDQLGHAQGRSQGGSALDGPVEHAGRMARAGLRNGPRPSALD